jgi:hypothetical protein
MGFSRLAYGVLVPSMRASLGGGFALYGAIGGANDRVGARVAW